MRFLITLLIFSFFFSCKQKQSNTASNQIVDTITQQEEKPIFFPVTEYFKGQLAEFRNRGINPIEYTGDPKHPDSSWIKSEDFEKAFKPFITPVIDSHRLSNKFEEKSFVDQTINSITFSYDPKQELSDSDEVRRWDVYVDPESQTIKRIYIVKKLPSGNMQQLTWQAGKWAKIIELDPEKDGNAAIISQREIKWDF